MASNRASSRIISLKRILSYTLLVELYNVTVILLDAALHSDSPLKGLGFRTAAGMFIQTIIPDVIIILAVFLIVFYITRRSEWLLRHTFLKVASDVILSVATAFAVYRLFYIVVLWRSPGMKLNWNEAFMNVTLILLIVEIIYYAHNYRDTVKKVELARRETLQYKYNVLKSQVNPHFLFNSLNILSSLIDEDIRKSHMFIDAFSELYRYIMEQQDKQEVDVKEEIECMQSFISILKMRHMNQFDVKVTGMDNIHGHKLIPMTLQPLIENITKHNIISTKYPMKAEIRIMSDSIEIVNPVRKRDRSSGNGIGLRLVSEQYRMYGKKVTINDTGDSFSVRIPYLQ